MTDPRGFLRLERRVAPYRPVAERRADFADVNGPIADDLAAEQARRCMDCGVPFCHSGCPLGNLIPDWNDLVERGRWREAYDALDATNNFPEFTGKLCPAPCEEACVLALNDDAVTIKQVEMAIIEHAFDAGWVTPRRALRASGKRVAIVGSGPAGLACAQQLARAGHAVAVFERDERPGGLLRFGIPDFKIEKRLVDRRVDQLVAEGVQFELSTQPDAALLASYDATVLATGAQRHRDLALPGRAAAGIEFAMPYLAGVNRHVAGSGVRPRISANGAAVVIIGGGDTSADCLGSAHREGAASVLELAHGPTPPGGRQPQRTWPEWPFLLRSYAAHGEGGSREYGFATTSFATANGHVTGVCGHRVEFLGYDGVGRRPAPVRRGGEELLPADLVLLAIGFTGVERDDPLFPALGIEISAQGTLVVDTAHGTGTLVGRGSRVFACGDAVTGADLIVTAIASGRECARSVDLALTGATSLPARDRPRIVSASI